MKKLTHKDYEDRLFIKEIDIYPLEEYITFATKIKHTCLKDHVFLASPNNVLSGRGCPICSIGIAQIKNTKTHEHYQSQVPSHITVVDQYINDRTPIRHKSSECGHEWIIAPTKILQGRGCSKCSITGFNKEKPAVLYFVKITDSLFKLGVTNRTIKTRFGSDWDKFDIKILWSISYTLGVDAYNMEQKLLSQYSHLLLNTGVLANGNTETLNSEIPSPLSN